VVASAEQAEEGVHEVPTMEMAQAEPSLMPASASMMGRMEAGTSEMSIENVAAG
jgi:hypothetical protein